MTVDEDLLCSFQTFKTVSKYDAKSINASSIISDNKIPGTA